MHEDNHITTYFLVTMAVQYSKYQTRSEVRYCTPHCAMLCNQQPKQVIKLSTITTYFLFKMAVPSFKYQTRS